VDEDLKRRLHESIRKWEARPRYPELTPSVLAGIPDDMLEQSVVDFVLAHGVWRHNDLLRLLASLPEGFGIVYSTWVLDAEVANGGFHQYFWNTEGRYLDLVTRAVQRLGSAENNRILSQAIKVYALEGRPDVAALAPEEQVQVFSKGAQESSLGTLDSQWYDRDLAAARVRLIREHPTLFTARLPFLPRLKLAVASLCRPKS